MSNTITTAHVQMYNKSVHLLFQQEGSVLRPHVRSKYAEGKYVFFDRLRATSAVQRTVRHGQTPLVNSQHSRRRAETSDWEWADLVDQQDLLRIGISPTASYVVNAGYALGRALDRVIIAAFNAAAREGEEGSTSTSFPAGNTNALGTALTVDALRTTMKNMDEGNVPATGRHFVLSPIGKEQLLRTTAVTSIDYNSVKALVNGELNTFLGFQFHMIADQDDGAMLPLSSNTRTAFAFHESSMGIGIPKDISTRISERDDLSYSLQVYACASFGAVRIEDAGVWAVTYDESL